MTGQKREEAGERKKENNSDSPFFPLGFILFLPMISGFMWCFDYRTSSWSSCKDLHKGSNLR